MARKYEPIKHHEKTIERMHKEGKNYREISEELGYSRMQIKECVRRPRRLAQKQAQNVPKRRGQPREQDLATGNSLQKEVARLRMENELLRDFLQAIERK